MLFNGPDVGDYKNIGYMEDDGTPTICYRNDKETLLIFVKHGYWCIETTTARELTLDDLLLWVPVIIFWKKVLKVNYERIRI